MVSTSTRGGSSTAVTAGWPRCRPCPASARPSAPRRGQLGAQGDRLGAVAGLADHLDVGLGGRGSSAARRAPGAGRRRAPPGSRRSPASTAAGRVTCEAAVGRGPALDLAADHRDPLPDADQPVAAAGPSRRPCARPSSVTVTPSAVSRRRSSSTARRRPGVLEHVGQRLLHDPVRRQVDARRHRVAAAPSMSTVDRQPGAATCVDQLVEVGQRRLRARGSGRRSSARCPGARRAAAACRRALRCWSARSRRARGVPRLVVVEHPPRARGPGARSPRSRGRRRRGARGRCATAPRPPPAGPAPPARPRAVGSRRGAPPRARGGAGWSGRLPRARRRSRADRRRRPGRPGEPASPRANRTITASRPGRAEPHLEPARVPAEGVQRVDEDDHEDAESLSKPGCTCPNSSIPAMVEQRTRAAGTGGAGRAARAEEPAEDREAQVVSAYAAISAVISAASAGPTACLRAVAPGDPAHVSR